MYFYSIILSYYLVCKYIQDEAFLTNSAKFFTIQANIIVWLTAVCDRIFYKQQDNECS